MPNDPDDQQWQRPENRERPERRDDRNNDPPDRGGGGFRERPYYEEPHRGVLILVLGIIGIMACPILGIFAWFMGGGDLRKMDAGQMDPEGRGMTQAGRIMGLISAIIMILYVVLFGVMFLGMFMFAAAVPPPGPAPAPNNQFIQPAPPVRAPMK
jgi:hypothetical protein